MFCVSALLLPAHVPKPIYALKKECRRKKEPKSYRWERVPDLLSITGLPGRVLTVDRFIHAIFILGRLPLTAVTSAAQYMHDVAFYITQFRWETCLKWVCSVSRQRRRSRACALAVRLAQTRLSFDAPQPGRLPFRDALYPVPTFLPPISGVCVRPGTPSSSFCTCSPVPTDHKMDFLFEKQDGSVISSPKLYTNYANLISRADQDAGASNA